MDARLTGRPPRATKIEIISAESLTWKASLQLAMGGISLIQRDFNWLDLWRSFQTRTLFRWVFEDDIVHFEEERELCRGRKCLPRRKAEEGLCPVGPIYPQIAIYGVECQVKGIVHCGNSFDPFKPMPATSRLWKGENLHSAPQGHHVPSLLPTYSLQLIQQRRRQFPSSNRGSV
jgi:hypothetical protein